MTPSTSRLITELDRELERILPTVVSNAMARSNAHISSPVDAVAIIYPGVAAESVEFSVAVRTKGLARALGGRAHPSLKARDLAKWNPNHFSYHGPVRELIREPTRYPRICDELSEIVRAMRGSRVAGRDWVTRFGEFDHLRRVALGAARRLNESNAAHWGNGKGACVHPAASVYAVADDGYRLEDDLLASFGRAKSDANGMA